MPDLSYFSAGVQTAAERS